MIDKDFNTPVNIEWRPFVDSYGIFGLARSSPRDFKLIDIRKGLDGHIETVEYGQLSPMMNVNGWYWRPSRFTSEAKTIEGEVVTASR